MKKMDIIDAPSAPPVEYSRQAAFYPLRPQAHSRNQPEVLPPPYSEVEVECPHTVADVKSVLVKYTQSKRFLRQRPAQGMQILNITPMHAYRYTLDTFYENRVVEDKCVPYNSDYVDGPQKGHNSPPPSKWNVPGPTDSQQSCANSSVYLPHSTSVSVCTTCDSSGLTICKSCNGRAFKRCLLCNGTRHVKTYVRYHGERIETNDVCPCCFGMGNRDCTSCQRGRVQCGSCRGHRFLKYWKSVKIQSKSGTEMFLTPRGELEKHLHAENGQTLITKKSAPQNPQPLKWSQDSSVSAVASQFINQRLRGQNTIMRVVEFKQRIEVIPVVKVNYAYEGERNHFYIYGRDNHVYFPGGYPRRFRAWCSII